MDITKRLEYAKKNSVPSNYLYQKDGSLQSPFLNELKYDKFTDPEEEDIIQKVLTVWKMLKSEMDIGKAEFIKMFMVVLVPDEDDIDETEIVSSRYEIMSNLVSNRVRWNDLVVRDPSKKDEEGNSYYDNWYLDLLEKDDDLYKLLIERLGIREVKNSNINLKSDYLVSKVTFIDQAISEDMGMHIFLSTEMASDLSIVSYTNAEEESIYIVNKDSCDTYKLQEDANVISYLFDDGIVLNLDLSRGVITYPKNTNTDYLDTVNRHIKDAINGIKIIKTEEDISQGSFELDIQVFNESQFYYMIILDNFMNRVYLRESGKPRSLIKKRVYNIMIRDKEVKFTLNRGYEGVLISFRGIDMDKRTVQEFYADLYVIFKYHESMRSGINTNIVSGEAKSLEDKIERNTSKINELKARSGDKSMFQPKYSKACSSHAQPIIVDPEDIQYWTEFLKHDGGERTFMIFKNKNYVCPNNDYPYPKLKDTKTFYAEKYEEYKCVPCCGSKYDPDFPEEPDDEECLKGKTGGGKKKKKYGILYEEGQEGHAVPHLSKMFEKAGHTIKRTGNSQSTNGSIRAVIRALAIEFSNSGDLPRRKEIKDIIKLYSRASDENEKEDIAMMAREKISASYNLCRQEAYDWTGERIKKVLADPNEPFRTDYFFRLIEEYFDCNLMVFVGGTKVLTIPELEKPRSLDYHVRWLNKDRKTIFLHRHKGNHLFYENISDDNGTYLFPSRTLKKIKKGTNDYLVWNIGNGSFRSNQFNKKIEEKCVYQSINEAGRAFAIVVNNKGKKMTMFIPDSPPFDCKVKFYHNIVNYISRDRAESYMGSKGVDGTQGLHFCGGIFIPVKERLEGPIHQLFEMCRRRRETGHLKKEYTYTELLLRLIIFYWAHDNKDLDTFISDRIREVDYKPSPPVREIVVVPEDNPISYIEESWPTVFREGKITLNKELIDGVIRYLDHYKDHNRLEKNRLMPLREKNYIDEEQFDIWKEERFDNYTVRNNIVSVDDPYVLEFEGKYYIVQKSDGNLSRALERCRIWKKDGINRRTHREFYHEDASYKLYSDNLTVDQDHVIGDEFYRVCKLEKGEFCCLLPLESN